MVLHVVVLCRMKDEPLKAVEPHELPQKAPGHSNGSKEPPKSLVSLIPWILAKDKSETKEIKEVTAKISFSEGFQ